MITLSLCAFPRVSLQILPLYAIVNMGKHELAWDSHLSPLEAREVVDKVFAGETKNLVPKELGLGLEYLPALDGVPCREEPCISV